MPTESYYQKNKPDFKLRYIKTKREKETAECHAEYYKQSYFIWCDNALTQEEKIIKFKELGQLVASNTNL
tara:strand:+ start:1792 stop:2001 length:210 start_codon:yes stop_codon:yes gene_type:complete